MSEPEHVVVRLSNSQVALLAASMKLSGHERVQVRDVTDIADQLLRWLEEKQRV